MALPTWLAAVLACPACHVRLDELRCPACGYRGTRSGDVVELLPPGWQPRPEWSRRQSLMVAAYDELVDDLERAARAYANDFSWFEEPLAALSGRVADVGGGNGIARHWLSAVSEYVVVEPSDEWWSQPWERLGDRYPCLREPQPTLRAVAEHLPLLDATVDGVLATFVLNHVAKPAVAIREMLRITRPGGRLVVVFDELEPTLSDLWRGAGPWCRRELLARKLRARVTGWPVAPDHLELRERRLRATALRAGARLETRAWRGPYLYWVLERL